jgi:hypothetical protein
VTRKLPPTTPPTVGEWISFGFLTLGTIGQVIGGFFTAVAGCIGSVLVGGLLFVVIGFIIFVILLLL